MQKIDFSEITLEELREKGPGKNFSARIPRHEFQVNPDFLALMSTKLQDGSFFSRKSVVVYGLVTKIVNITDKFEIAVFSEGKPDEIDRMIPTGHRQP